ncbi:head maturation protease, ClpP-related [Halomonas piscis]|uniref:head maturation protease, ClpP-related n=1 Tax=Halomonas piscis TaxID=3031727 RepID=UPI002898D72C|nr:head maturation protease, ClpP-related [Halomonas piscis]
MKWFNVKARDDNARHAHVVIDKAIGSDWAPDWIADFTGEKPARELIDEIEALGELDEITVELNSPGGDVASGVRIYNYLKNHCARIHTRVTGCAASIATVIMMAGDTRSMAIGSTMMTHRASGLMVGFFNAREMEETATALKTVDASMVDIYAAATGKPAEEIGAMLDEGDVFHGATEALEWGFATEADNTLKAVASANPGLYMKQLEQQGEIARLKAQLKGQGSDDSSASMTAADALALAFDMTPEQAEAQAADLGDRIMALSAAGSQGQASARAVAEPIAKALDMTTSAVLDDPKAAADRINDKVNEVGELAVNQDRTRITAIIKACNTTGQGQLLEKLVNNGMAEEQATEYIYDVAAASGNRHSINNSHSPEDGHRPGIDYAAIYARQNGRYAPQA